MSNTQLSQEKITVTKSDEVMQSMSEQRANHLSCLAVTGSAPLCSTFTGNVSPWCQTLSFDTCRLLNYLRNNIRYLLPESPH